MENKQKEETLMWLMVGRSMSPFATLFLVVFAIIGVGGFLWAHWLRPILPVLQPVAIAFAISAWLWTGAVLFDRFGSALPAEKENRAAWISWILSRPLKYPCWAALFLSAAAAQLSQ